MCGKFWWPLGTFIFSVPKSSTPTRSLSPLWIRSRMHARAHPSACEKCDGLPLSTGVHMDCLASMTKRMLSFWLNSGATSSPPAARSEYSLCSPLSSASPPKSRSIRGTCTKSCTALRARSVWSRRHRAAAPKDEDFLGSLASSRLTEWANVQRMGGGRR